MLSWEEEEEEDDVDWCEPGRTPLEYWLKDVGLWHREQSAAGSVEPHDSISNVSPTTEGPTAASAASTASSSANQRSSSWRSCTAGQSCCIQGPACIAAAQSKLKTAMETLELSAEIAASAAKVRARQNPECTVRPKKMEWMNMLQRVNKRI